MFNDDRLAVSARILSDPELLSGNPELAYLLVNIAHLLDIHITRANGENFADKVRVAANAIRQVNVGDRQGVENIVAETKLPSPRLDTESELETRKALSDPEMTVVLRDCHPNLINWIETAQCKLEVHAESLPKLIRCNRLTVKARSFSAPLLTSCDRVVNFATTISLPMLKECDYFADVKAAAIHLPSLEKVNLFSTHNAKVVSLPRLKEYGSFWVYHGAPRIEIGVEF